MKIIKIGRSSSNDIVVNDVLVTRNSHCQIILDDRGIYRLIDNSLNGTFVNGIRMGKGAEVRLNQSDIIRIGNTTLPWQTYFKNTGGTEIDTRYFSPIDYQEPKKGNGFGIAALCCGVVGMFFGGFILGTLAIIFGGVALNRKEKSKGLGITGLVLGIIAVAITIIVLIFLGTMWSFLLG